MWFVEQPEFRTSSSSDGDGCSSALTGGESADGNVEQTRFDLHSVGARLLLRVRHTGGSPPEANVLTNGQIVVEHRLVADVADAGTNRTAISKQIRVEHGGGPGFGSNQTGAQTQQRRLSGTVRTLEKNGLSGLDAQRRSSERGKAAKQHDDVIEFDHGHV